jgi:hypothetical protein
MSTKPIEERPASLQAEQTILGAMLIEPMAIADATTGLLVEDFSIESHQRIYEAMLDLADVGKSIDIVTLSEVLKTRKLLDSIGGMSYLFSLSENLPRRLSIKNYVRIVRDKSLLRKLMAVCDAGLMEAADQSLDAIEIFSGIQSRLTELASTALRSQKHRDILVGAEDFMRDTPPATEWAVEGLIQRGGNGIVVGDPGSAKSYTTLDLAYHLVAGVDWMGCKVPRRMKVAYIAREDHPGLTQHRGKSLQAGYGGTAVGHGLSYIDLNEWLYYNTRSQSETFSLQNQMDVQEIIDAFKDKGIEIAFFDVFRRLWEGDENDNKEVAKVLAVLTRIQTEVGCSVCLVHHLNKSEGGTIFQRIRGAGSIYGWREWAFGISIENPQDDPKDRVRKIVFETKAATPASPIYYSFDGDDDRVVLASCSAPAPSYKKPAKGKGKKEESDYIPWYAEDK